jgi:hypothetical protein
MLRCSVFKIILLGTYMSERMKKHRQKLADQGLKVVELALSKQILHDFQILADYHGMHRSVFMSSFIGDICSSDDFKYFVIRHIKIKNPVSDSLRDKFRDDYTDYTLS